jgi:hypothetical protein
MAPSAEEMSDHESFSWDEWQQIEGGKWKSPGGRVLSDQEYQQRKNSGEADDGPDRDTLQKTQGSLVRRADLGDLEAMNLLAAHGPKAAEEYLRQHAPAGKAPADKPAKGGDAEPGGNVPAQLGAVGGALAGAALGPLGSLAGAVAGGVAGWLAGRGGTDAKAAAASDAKRFAAGDPQAAKDVAEKSGEALGRAAQAAKGVPAGDPGQTRAAWDSAAKDVSPQLAQPLGSHLEQLATERDPAKVHSILGGILHGLAALPLAVAKGVVGAIGSFAAAVHRSLGPYGWWVGSILAATAVAAVPALAVGAGLLEWPYALAAAPLAAGAFFKVKQMGADRATASATKNWGSPSEPMSERVSAAEVLDAMVHRFGWRPRYAEAVK